MSRGGPLGMATVSIRPYAAASDEPQVHHLWQATLGARWPLSRTTFRQVTVESGVYHPDDHWIAAVDDQVIGFVGTQVRHVPGAPAPAGELLLIMVEPSRQRQGVGRALLDHALAALKQRGVREVQIGGGGISYFWAGVPTNLPGAWSFFQACGWSEVERSFDLIRDLSDYATPAGIHERVRLGQIVIETARSSDGSAALAFEQQYFPRWLHVFERVVAHGATADIVLARDATGVIVGTSLVMAPGSRWQNAGFKW